MSGDARCTLEIVICGLPSSGNRFVQRMIDRWIAATREVHDRNPYTYVWHGLKKPIGGEGRHAKPGADLETKLVLPVRNTHFRATKIARYADYPPDGCSEGICQMIKERDIKVIIPVSYEGLVESPDPVSKDLAKRLGLIWTPFPEVVFDGNEKYRTPESRAELEERRLRRA